MPAAIKQNLHSMFALSKRIFSFVNVAMLVNPVDGKALMLRSQVSIRLLAASAAFALLLIANKEAQACCSYGCCDCSCVSAIPEPVANEVLESITNLLLARGYTPAVIDLSVKTIDNDVIVLHKYDSAPVQQPSEKKVNH